MENRFNVSEKVLQNILNYLKTRPYHEVFTLIQGLQQDAVIITTPKDAEVKDESNG